MRRYSVYTHKVNDGQSFLNKKEFESRFGSEDAKAFLGQIIKSFREVQECRSRGAFYSGLRFCFSELDTMGKFYKGEVSTSNTAENTIAFMRSYLGEANRRYKKLSGLIIDMYRHGLMHTHMIKNVKLDDGKILGWELQDNDDSDKHLQVEKRAHGGNLVINVNRLIEDSIEAINLYQSKLDRNKNLLNRFKKGYFGMAVAVEQPTKNQNKKTNQKLKLTMKEYSYDGIQLLKKEMSK